MQQLRGTPMAGSGIEQPRQGCLNLAAVPEEVHLELRCQPKTCPFRSTLDRLLAHTYQTAEGLLS